MSILLVCLIFPHKIYNYFSFVRWIISQSTLTFKDNPIRMSLGKILNLENYISIDLKCQSSCWASSKNWEPAKTSIYPSKHDTLKQCCFNVGKTSSTLAQSLNNIVLMYRDCSDLPRVMISNPLAPKSIVRRFVEHNMWLWVDRCRELSIVSD